MSNIVLLILCFVWGVILRRSKRLPENAHVALNGFIIHVSLPSLAVLHIHRLSLTRDLFYSAGMAWLLFTAGLVFFWAVARFLGFDRRTTGALMLVGGLGNTSFVGLPMIAAYYGRDLLGVGLIVDQLGSFLVLSTVGFVVATTFAEGAVTPRFLARRIALFPPFQAILLAVVLRPVSFPPLVEEVLQRVGDTLSPLALISVGYQLQLRQLRGELKPLGVGLAYKLVLGPAVMYLLYVTLLRGSGPIMRVTLFEAAMAPMITAGIVACEHKLNPPLVTLMLGIGIPLSFLTLPVWWWLLQGV